MFHSVVSLKYLRRFTKALVMESFFSKVGELGFHLFLKEFAVGVFWSFVFQNSFFMKHFQAAACGTKIGLSWLEEKSIKILFILHVTARFAFANSFDQ